MDPQRPHLYVLAVLSAIVAFAHSDSSACLLHAARKSTLSSPVMMIGCCSRYFASNAASVSVEASIRCTVHSPSSACGAVAHPKGGAVSASVVALAQATSVNNNRPPPHAISSALPDFRQRESHTPRVHGRGRDGFAQRHLPYVPVERVGR